MRFLIHKARDGQFYFEIQSAGKYEVIASSPRYWTLAACRMAIDLVKQGAASAAVVDRSDR